MKKKKRFFLFDIKFLLVILLVLISLSLWYIRKQKKENLTESILTPVKVIKPEYGTLQKSFRMNGHIESEKMVTILPRVSGILNELNVEVGQKVSKNQLIALVDNEPLELNLKQAEAAYLAAKSSFDRIDRLYQSKATSKQSYDQAKSQYEATKSQYDLAKLQYEYANIKSPIDGVVLMKHVDEGNLVADSVPIVTIGDIHSLVIKTKIPEKYYEIFARKQKKIRVEVVRPDSSGEDIQARIKNISPYISAETKNFETVCEIINPPEVLRPGMFVYITYVLEEKEDIYYLPYDVFVSGSEVWMLEKQDDITEKTNLERPFYNESFFEVSGELKDREFIIEGQYFIKEGQKVRVLNRPGEE